MKILVLLLSALFVVACATKKYPDTNTITPPKVIKSPDFTKLSAKSCKSGEVIKTSATLRLDKYGKVTDVYGLDVQDVHLASQIIDQFKRAKYTPYLQGGVPIAKNLNVVLSLTCPK